MTAPANYLAFDFGASSGRAMLAAFDGSRFHLEEVHRFENGPSETSGGLFWDAPQLFEEIKTGLRACRDRDCRLASVGIDTWGVDFALLDANDQPLALPRHYRDPRNLAAMNRALQQVPRDRIYATTGIQFMAFNSLFQLHAETASTRRLLESARRLLFMPDLFNYWLTGQAQTEPTIASTSQAMDARRVDWDHELLDLLGIPSQIMPLIQPTGTLAGRIKDDLAADVGQHEASVVLTASHDTAAAVAAVPAVGDNWAYISSGTWSLVGLELPEPLISDATLAANFTNEAGVAGTVRFLKNVAGLWLVQECRRRWALEGNEFSFEQLHAMAEQAPPLRSLIDPDDPRYTTPGNMPGRIRRACAERNQPVPGNEGEVIRCMLDSLALRYDAVLRAAAGLTARKLETIHIVGGGAQNDLLNRLVAAAADRPVVAGPFEATALGNAAVQAIAMGDLPDLPAARAAIAASVQPRRFDPPSDASEKNLWNEARQRFAELTAAQAVGES